MGNCRKFKWSVTLTLTLDRVKVTTTYTVRVGLLACMQARDCSITHYGNTAIWISWNIDNRRSLNSRDSFPRRKFKNQAPTSCRPAGLILWLPTVSFELRAKVVEEIDLEMCSYGQLAKVQMLRDLDFAVSHILTHYYAASHRVAWSVGLSVALTVCHASEPFEPSTVLWAFHTIQPSILF